MWTILAIGGYVDSKFKTNFYTLKRNPNVTSRNSNKLHDLF